MKKLLILSLLFSLFLPISSNAAEILTDTEVYTDNQKTYFENLYIGAGRTIVDSQINSDLTVLGGEVLIKNKISGDVFVVGGDAVFEADILGDLRVIGGDVKVSGNIVGDLFLIGGNIDLQNANLLGDVIIVGADVLINSEINNKSKIVAAKVFVNSKITSPIEITAQKLSFGESAILESNLSYYSPQAFIKNENSQINGEVVFNQIKNIQDTSFVKQAILNITSFWLVLKFITTLLIAFGLVYIFKVFSTEVSMLAIKSPAKSLLAGILLLVFTPVILVILFISLAGMPIAILLILAIMFISIISPSLVGIFIGSWVRKRLNKTADYLVDFHSAAFGVILLTIIQFIPVIGSFISFVLGIIAIGAIVRYIRVSIFK